MSPDSDRIALRVTAHQARLMVLRGQARKDADGNVRLRGAGDVPYVMGGRTYTASGGPVPHQVYTSSDSKGMVTGFRFLAPEDRPVFYSAVVDCLSPPLDFS